MAVCAYNPNIGNLRLTDHGNILASELSENGVAQVL